MSTRFDSNGSRLRMHELQHSGYPVQQLASSRSTRFQMGFARMTMHLLAEMKDVVLEPSEAGLLVLGSTEMALALPADMIRRIHGADVEIGAPEVRLFHGAVVQEPVMGVRAVVARRHAEAALHELITRAAEIDEVDWLAPEATLRARATLRNLLGYPKALAAISGGKADLDMWLSHYAPVPPEPGQAA